jgi:hypothetical protein
MEWIHTTCDSFWPPGGMWLGTVSKQEEDLVPVL